RWTAEIPELTGLLVANEWLDNVPADVVELAADGPSLVLVDTAGRERIGPPAGPAGPARAGRWGPPAGLRARARGAPGPGAAAGGAGAGAGGVGGVRRGVAIAIDDAHPGGAGGAGAVRGGTLPGSGDGGRVRPVPDGSCALPAHVALDACPAAAAAPADPADP